MQPYPRAVRFRSRFALAIRHSTLYFGYHIDKMAAVVFAAIMWLCYVFDEISDKPWAMVPTLSVGAISC